MTPGRTQARRMTPAEVEIDVTDERACKVFLSSLGGPVRCPPEGVVLSSRPDLDVVGPVRTIGRLRIR